MVSKKELDEPGINSEQEVRVFLKVTNAKSNVVLIDTSKKGFLSTYDQVAKFISTHGEQEPLHLAEYGTEKSLDSPDTGRRKKGNGKHWNSIASTTVSTIPVDSDARLSIPSVRSSISSDASGVVADSKGSTAARPNEPVLMSTKITEEDDAENRSGADISETETKAVTLPKDVKDHSSQSTLPNGSDGKPVEEEQRNNGVSLKEEKLGEEAPAVDEVAKKSEESAKTPSRAQKRKKVSKSLSDSTSLESSTEQAPKRQKKLEQPFDTASDMSTPTNTNGDTSMEDDSSSGSACTLDPSFYYGSRLLDNSEWEDLAKSMCVWGSIGIGEWVFARWRDKNYYSGKISKRGHNDTWHIDFEDDMSDVASEAHILPLKTIGVGARAVYSPDNVYKPAIAEVVGQKLTDAESTEYAIKCEGYGVTILCKRRQLSLKESVAKELRKHYNSNIKMKAADVSFENILPETKRRPRGIVASSFDASAADESVFKDSGVNTPTPKKRMVKRSKSINKTDDSNSVDGDSISANSKDAVATTPTPKAEMQEKVASKETPKASNKNKEAAKKPKNENELFEGYQFMLTASGGGDPNLRGNITIAYDKDEFRAQIEAKGGEVVDVVGREVRKKHVFLISDSYARTVKYIYCLAGGIPCVSYVWISHCLKEGRIVDWKPHQLSSGLSLERNEVIPYHSRKPLKGLKLYVTAETDELYNYWKPVLTAAGATLLKPIKNPMDQLVPEDAEVVVTDHSCSLELFEHTVSKGKPIVMPEWLVQSIITGERASFDGHERYQVNPSEFDEEDD